MSKQDIENELKNSGDFVQIDHLTRFMKEDLPTDTKRFVCMKLCEIYEKKNMYSEAAKMADSAAIYTIPFSDKIKSYVKEVELYIKAGFFDRADEAMKKAIGQANNKERVEIYSAIKEFYKKQAEVYEKELRRANAVRVYEKLLEMNITDIERKEIKEKLLDLYDKLGKVKEFLTLKKSLE